jgi:hypothetical protein
VHDPERASVLVARLVGGVQPVEDPLDDGADDLDGDRVALLGARPREAGERLAVHVLHHEEHLVVGGDDVDGGDDVRVADAARDARLVEEHRRDARVLGEVPAQPLDRDGAREADGTEEPPEMDGRHPADRYLVEDRIAVEQANRKDLVPIQHPWSMTDLTTRAAHFVGWIGGPLWSNDPSGSAAGGG